MDKFFKISERGSTLREVQGRHRAADGDQVYVQESDEGDEQADSGRNRVFQESASCP